MPILIIVAVIAYIVYFIKTIVEHEQECASNPPRERTPEEWERWEAERQREKEEEEREREEQKRREDLETAAFIAIMEAGHQRKLSRACCGSCLHSFRHEDSEGNITYYCPQYGHISSEEGDRPHYCEYFDTL